MWELVGFYSVTNKQHLKPLVPLRAWKSLARNVTLLFRFNWSRRLCRCQPQQFSCWFCVSSVAAWFPNFICSSYKRQRKLGLNYWHYRSTSTLGPAYYEFGYYQYLAKAIKQFLPAATKLWPRLCFYVSVILFTGGVFSRETPPRTRQGEPPPPRSRLQQRVNERPVRILLECILVFL